jgi:hypothetical protein
MHRSEEWNLGEKMEVDSMVALESQPTKPKIIFNIGILSSVANVFGEVEGFTHVQAFALVETITHFNGIVDSMLFGMTVKDDCVNSIVEACNFDFGITRNNCCPYYHCTKSCCCNKRLRHRC